MSTYTREVLDGNLDTVDIFYFCSRGCWTDSFEPERIGPAVADAMEGRANPTAASDVEGEIHCAECGVLMKSDWRDTPISVNLIERPPLSANGAAEPVNPLPDPELDQANPDSYLGERTYEGGTTTEPVTFRLHLWWDGRMKETRARVAYVLLANHELIFSGEDFHPGPSQAPDGDDAAGCLVGFLSLKPGDTDAEYFETYSERQLEFAREHGEEMSIWSMELEGELE